MKPTATPAYRPTADCIWTSFLASGKRHLVVTGGRRSGKSTLLAALAPRLGAAGALPGLTTWAQPGRAVYLKENITGRTAVIGRFDPALPGPENRMRPVAEGFCALGVPALRRCADAAGEWTLLDEAGYLETACPEYCAAVLKLMSRKRLAAAVRKQDLPFLRWLRRHPDVFCVDLDAPFGSLGCVIMASGLGRRFGGGKLLAPFAGRPLLQYALDATQGVFARRVAVTRSAEAAAFCREQGVPVLLHSRPFRSDTVRLGLAALRADAGQKPPAGCLFCPADQPLLRRETVAGLALCAADDPQSIWRPAWQGKPGAPVLFPAWAYPELRALPEGRGGGAVAQAHPGSVRLLPAADEWELADIDTPADLARLEAALAGRQGSGRPKTAE